MSDAQMLADRYTAAWNETDPARRRASITALWAPDGAHYVRSIEAHGHDALEQRIVGSHNNNVRDKGYRFRAVNNAQALSDVVTFNWEMVRPGGDPVDEVLATGLEFLRLDATGRIVTDYQFIIA